MELSVLVKPEYNQSLQRGSNFILSYIFSCDISPNPSLLPYQ